MVNLFDKRKFIIKEDPIDIDNPLLKPFPDNRRSLKCKQQSRKELKIGTKIEMEHTGSKKIARRIAKNHLKKFPRYYTRGILPMQKRLKKLKGGCR